MTDDDMLRKILAAIDLGADVDQFGHISLREEVDEAAAELCSEYERKFRRKPRASDLVKLLANDWVR